MSRSVSSRWQQRERDGRWKVAPRSQSASDRAQRQKKLRHRLYNRILAYSSDQLYRERHGELLHRGWNRASLYSRQRGRAVSETFGVFGGAELGRASGSGAASAKAHRVGVSERCAARIRPRFLSLCTTRVERPRRKRRQVIRREKEVPASVRPWNSEARVHAHLLRDLATLNSNPTRSTAPHTERAIAAVSCPFVSLLNHA